MAAAHEQAETITVQTERLDDVLPETVAPALLKIDVEGGELEVMKGALETICRHRPIIVFEHGKPSAAAYGTKPTDVYDLLVTQASLRIYDLDGVGPITRDEFSELFETGARWNFVARS